MLNNIDKTLLYDGIIFIVQKKSIADCDAQFFVAGTGLEPVTFGL